MLPGKDPDAMLKVAIFAFAVLAGTVIEVRVPVL
jgi:hypothetical protein